MKHRLPSSRAFVFLLALLLAVSSPAQAADAPAPRAPRSQNVTINLINRLVERGLLPQSDADELIKQAQEDAAAARAEALAATPAGPAPAPAGTVRVTYVPEIMRTQIRDELKAEVLAQARAERWADPRAVPDWVTRFRVSGDLRVRGEGVIFPSGNDNTGAFPNFNAINTGSPFDVSGSVFSPQLNVDQDRNRLRLRARIGAEVQLGDGYTTGLRLATGDNNSPVSANQSFGASGSGQGGNFSKYAIWLDRAFLKYETGDPEANLAATFGRFENPFFSTDLIWDDDLGFDGFAVRGSRRLAGDVTGFVTAGAFPVFNTDLNFASNQPAKFRSTDKWLYGAQLGADWKIRDDVRLKAGLAYYDFQNIEGRLSSPFTPLNSSDQGDTDGTRPAFAQKGNTYMALRNITPSALNGFGTTSQFQYFGLATPYRDLALTVRLDLNHYAPVQVSFLADFVKNLAADPVAIAAKAVNNLGAAGAGSYAGSDYAWLFGVRVGHVALEKRGDWSLALNWRRVGSDAVVDGFNDSDFGGGGTNVQGYTLAATYALSPRVALGLRWMSSNEVAGPAFKTDSLTLDLNAKF